MMKDVQDTSLDAYYNVVKPTIGARQQKVFDTIKLLGCPTDAELASFLHMDTRSVAPRRYELMNMGKVVEVEKRKCSVTKKTAKSWRVV